MREVPAERSELDTLRGVLFFRRPPGIYSRVPLENKKNDSRSFGGFRERLYRFLFFGGISFFHA